MIYNSYIYRFYDNGIIIITNNQKQNFFFADLTAQSTSKSLYIYHAYIFIFINFWERLNDLFITDIHKDICVTMKEFINELATKCQKLNFVLYITPTN